MEVWGNNYQCTIQALFKLQKRAMRIIHKVGFLEHSNKLFIQSKLFKIHDIIKYHTVQILFKAFNNLLPSNIQKFFIVKECAHNLRGFAKFSL